MSLSRNEKESVITEVSVQAAKSQTLALAEYRGLAVSDLDQLRKIARQSGVYLHVLKNTLARRAIKGTVFESASEHMSGPLIYSFSEDAVAAAKVLADFAKNNDKLVLKAGAYNGKVLDINAVKALAAIPSKEVLLAQLLGLMQSPISRLARVISVLAEKKSGGTSVDDAALLSSEAPASV